MLLFSTLLDINKSLTKEAFIRLVMEWNQSSTHENNIIHDMEWNGERNIRFGTDRLWLGIEEYPSQNIIAVRYEKEDDNGAVWTTDYVMNFNSLKMAVRLDRSYTAEALETDGKFSTPHFITLLIEHGYLADDNGLPVQRTATEIHEKNVNLVADVINKVKHYRLPVVYVSKTNSDENPVDVAYLASRLKGVAHVFTQNSLSLNQELREACDSKNEYFGGIGIYFPTKAVGHRQYIYRSAVGYDDFLMEKVVQSVIQYSNAQMLDTLFTWQGVNNAMLRDSLTSQREERLAAEKAQKTAEAEAAQLLDTWDEEERKIKKQALDDARAEADILLDGFDDDMQKLQRQVEELTRSNEALQFENQGLKAKLDSREANPVLYMGDEYEFYSGEIKDLLLEILSEALMRVPEKSRRADVTKDIIDHNDYKKMSMAKAEEIKRLLKNYDGMSSKTRQVLQELGFEISENGKHYKVSYYGDGRYQRSFSKTPSDFRSGKNCAQELINLIF